MEICGKYFKIFDRIDFKIIALKGRRKCLFVPRPTGSMDFDSHWCQKLKLYKVEVFEIQKCVECEVVVEKI
jgi:hypothetical protein